MKSLQVLTPNQKCIFNCPFCISKVHEHDNNFINNYYLNKQLWKNNLIAILKNNLDLKYIVITGTNEPMQSKDCVKDIITIVRDNRKDIQIEIQTRMYNYDQLYEELDVVAYSISDYKMLSKIKVSDQINRFVILLTSSFNDKTLEDIIKNISSKVTQLTFKVLHNSNGINKEIDEWIVNNKIDEETEKDLLKDINNYKGKLSIRYDPNCMDSKDRYAIYREDAKLYSTWEEI